MAILAVDTGGTFTDFYLRTRAGVRIHKVLSTPGDPSRAIRRGIRELRAEGISLVHGSTVATNAFLERKGAKVALITTEGFEDVLHIGRQNRPSLYDLSVHRPIPLVPPALRFGLKERLNARGGVEIPLSENSLRALRKKIKHTGIDSIAVCLMFSYTNPRHEKKVRTQLKNLKKNLSVSSEICPEYREYERTSTTCINAYVAPVMNRYLGKLHRKIQSPVRIMQSNGGSLSIREAADQSVRTLLSGPAGGALGAFQWGQRAGIRKIISFDMGGTSTDLSLMDGALELTTESRLGGLPVKTPMIRIDTIGAGGGSLAWVDQGGALRVGPQSAGAEPGPICYGRGGEAMTITDAHVYLGRLPPQYFLGGKMTLKYEKISLYLKELSKKLKLSSKATAEGIIAVANANMARALRVLSLERGYDPRAFTLIPFGGAGGLHACELAEILGMRRVLVPKHPGILSAYGMAGADWVRDYVQTVLWGEGESTPSRLNRLFSNLKNHAWEEAKREGFSKNWVGFQTQLDVRFRGQSFELSVPATRQWAQAFLKAHRRRYGFVHHGEMEIVNLRLQARVRLWTDASRPKTAGKKQKPFPAGQTRLLWKNQRREIPVYLREQLGVGHRFRGPAVVAEFSATTFIPPEWELEVDPWRNLKLGIRT